MLSTRSLRSKPLVDEKLISAPIPSTCQVVAEHHLGTAVFRLFGELDVTTAAEVCTLLAIAYGEAAVVLDLAEVKLIDAEGLSVLRDVIGAVHEHGGLVAVARPWRVAVPVLGLVGTDGFVFLAISAAGAVSWLSDPKNFPHPHLGAMGA